MNRTDRGRITKASRLSRVPIASIRARLGQDHQGHDDIAHGLDPPLEGDKGIVGPDDTDGAEQKVETDPSVFQQEAAPIQSAPCQDGGAGHDQGAEYRAIDGASLPVDLPGIDGLAKVEPLGHIPRSGQEHPDHRDPYRIRCLLILLQVRPEQVQDEDDDEQGRYLCRHNGSIAGFMMTPLAAPHDPEAQGMRTMRVRHLTHGDRRQAKRCRCKDGKTGRTGGVQRDRFVHDLFDPGLSQGAHPTTCRFSGGATVEENPPWTSGCG